LSNNVDFKILHKTATQIQHCNKRTWWAFNWCA